MGGSRMSSRMSSRATRTTRTTRTTRATRATAKATEDQIAAMMWHSRDRSTRVKDLLAFYANGGVAPHASGAVHFDVDLVPRLTGKAAAGRGSSDGSSEDSELLRDAAAQAFAPLPPPPEPEPQEEDDDGDGDEQMASAPTEEQDSQAGLLEIAGQVSARLSTRMSMMFMGTGPLIPDTIDEDEKDAPLSSSPAPAPSASFTRPRGASVLGELMAEGVDIDLDAVQDLVAADQKPRQEDPPKVKSPPPPDEILEMRRMSIQAAMFGEEISL
jgi:hypothetical protein